MIRKWILWDNTLILQTFILCLKLFQNSIIYLLFKLFIIKFYFQNNTYYEINYKYYKDIQNSKSN